MPDQSSDEPAPTNRPPQIILITGNMASGKSSIAQALAEQLPRSMHLRGDLFRRMIVNGQADMAFDLSAEVWCTPLSRQRTGQFCGGVVSFLG